jgi:hypothetical protein
MVNTGGTNRRIAALFRERELPFFIKYGIGHPLKESGD